MNVNCLNILINFNEITPIKFSTFMAFAKQHALNMESAQLSTLVVAPINQEAKDVFQEYDLLNHPKIISGPEKYQSLKNCQHQLAVNEYLINTEQCTLKKAEEVGQFNRVLIMGEFNATLHSISQITYLEKLSAFILLLLKKYTVDHTFVRVQICQASSENSKKFAQSCLPKDISYVLSAPLYQSVVRANGRAIDFKSSSNYYDHARIFLHEILRKATNSIELKEILEYFYQHHDEFTKIIKARESKKKDKTLDTEIKFSEMMSDMQYIQYYSPAMFISQAG